MERFYETNCRRKIVEPEIRNKIYGIFLDVILMNDPISVKCAAGRTKDLLVLPKLEALREPLNEED